RLSEVPTALGGIRSSLLSAAETDQIPALRQIRKVAEQADVWAGINGDTGYFDTLISKANGVSDSLRNDLERAARGAQEAYAEFAGFLRAELADKAPTKDAVGEE